MGSKWPALKRTVPTYPPLYVSIARVVPTFFIMGACIELFMQKVPIGGRTFYDVALDKEVRTLCCQQLFRLCLTPTASCRRSGATLPRKRTMQRPRRQPLVCSGTARSAAPLPLCVGPVADVCSPVKPSRQVSRMQRWV